MSMVNGMYIAFSLLLAFAIGMTWLAVKQSKKQ